MKPLGVLLAGGLSRRMGGGDKGLMPLGGKPVMQHAFERLNAQTDGIIINANGDPSRFAGFETTVVPDTISGFAGPLAGVLAGIRYAEALETSPTFIVTGAADTPFFPDTLVERFLSEAKTDKTIVLAGSNGRRHPVFGLWPVSLADHLEAWLSDEENRKVLAWVDQHSWAMAEFEGPAFKDHDTDPFFNINTPEDFAIAEQLLADNKTTEPTT